jgi:hypothetical protein
MSTLRVNNVTDLGLDAVVTNGVVEKGALPSGSVLQVVSTTKTDQFTTSSTTFASVTGLSATITPTSTSSKIMVMVVVNWAAQASSIPAARVTRNGTAVGIGDSLGTRTRSSAASRTGAIYATDSVSATFLDSPNSVSALTYQVEVVVNTGSLVIGGTGDNSSDPANHATVSTITLMEIAG